MFGLDVIAVSGILTLASAADIRCGVPKAPVVSINPTTSPIEYDFSKTTAQLSAVQSNTVNPYAPGTDTTTGGLRHDQPQMKMEVKWGYKHYTREGVVCFWYDSVKIDIALHPKIYVAREFNIPGCRDAILEHERKHVVVDRQVVNKYANEIGLAVQKAVNTAGAMGPYNDVQMKSVQDQLSQHIQSAIETQSLPMEQEMRKLQAQVDTLAEYQRVGKYCKAVRKR